MDQQRWERAGQSADREVAAGEEASFQAFFADGEGNMQTQAIEVVRRTPGRSFVELWPTDDHGREIRDGEPARFVLTALGAAPEGGS